ncbi:hypothetical protein PEC106568_42970 [Pectobacterium carotovorum subsp. carotovorum]|nr:hypothetical protein PEC106568_42970 [Pectobacterium carotovorum subsp. carotovorum]
MTLDWNVITTGLIAPIIVLFVKTLLDMKLIRLFVKYFHWIPVRGMFRSNPISISGKWEQTWDSNDSINFPESIDRHSFSVIRQFGAYCYAEFTSKSDSYVLFGEIVGDFLVGEWYEKYDKKGYFGTVQLEIIDSNTMNGRWIGHSKTKHEVKGGIWCWKKASN